MLEVAGFDKAEFAKWSTIGFVVAEIETFPGRGVGVLEAGLSEVETQPQVEFKLILSLTIFTIMSQVTFWVWLISCGRWVGVR